MTALPFEPEPDEALRARFWRALEAEWDFTSDDPAKMPCPGEHRSQVFDFECGARIVLSRDRLDADVVELHLSTSLAQMGVTPEMLSRDFRLAFGVAISAALAHLARITDHLPPFNDATISGGGVLHLRALQKPDGSFAGGPPVPVPRPGGPPVQVQAVHGLRRPPSGTEH